VRPDRIVLIAPLLDDDGSFSQTVEDFSVEAFVAQLAVERLTVAVLPWTSGYNVKRPGITVLANENGRASIQELFAEVPVDWRRVLGAPSEWRSTHIKPVGHGFDSRGARHNFNYLAVFPH
jgi:hypothetical protein